MKLMIVNGSVREGRRSDTVQAWVTSILEQDPELELDNVDLKEVDLPFFNEAVNPSDNNGVYVNPKGQAWADRVANADAFIFLVAEYNHGPTAVLKNAIDWVYAGWMNKPVGFVSYGGLVGGSRAVEQLRQIVLHVKLFPAASAVHISRIGSAFDENNQPHVPELNNSLNGLIEELKDLQQRLAK